MLNQSKDTYICPVLDYIKRDMNGEFPDSNELVVSLQVITGLKRERGRDSRGPLRRLSSSLGENRSGVEHDPV
jgi:hypothetical protein